MRPKSRAVCGNVAVNPDLELVHIREGESFAAWKHGYPFRMVRWHYHPEYEIHLVSDTSGKFYIGDFIGDFQPGQLIMTGPNLPQNWISDIADGEIVPRRSLVIQFPEDFIANARKTMPELEAIDLLLERSRRGLLFDASTSAALRPRMEQMIDARGLQRLILFWQILQILSQAREPRILSSLSFQLDLEKANAGGVNRAIAHLRDHLTEQVDETTLARLVGQSASVFSRAFRRYTGTTFTRYRNQLRVDLVCQMLVTRPDLKVAEICFYVGFHNLSNFNRHFLKLKGMSPTRFRETFAANDTFAHAD